QLAAAAAAAGAPIGARFAQHVLGQGLDHRALAQPGRPAQQQRMAKATGIQGRGGLVVEAPLPGGETVRAHACTCRSSQAATAAATSRPTACGGCAASITAKRSGSAAARWRKPRRTRSKKS